MTNVIYQARAGDGFRKRGLKRDTYFRSAEDAISEVLALKEKMDSKYNNEIAWDYAGEITGNTAKMKILKGYLGGDKKTDPFFLQIVSIEENDTANVDKPIHPKKISTKDKKVMNKAIKLFK
ncbi:hypothetical protein [Bacillus suaedaesalsae]|uniref:Uncharacterized protein n=1 Tax=Bacillus suaedaesalsae TaxID=2810349 RepID=A0ABS2DHI7_9BACI|nr:hypothetical protein [Bacillus suaedaesalsae]MBM6617008.1 hypothetical protein [Bacillus suaedaesalsae]